MNLNFNSNKIKKKRDFSIPSSSGSKNLVDFNFFFTTDGVDLFLRLSIVVITS